MLDVKILDRRPYNHQQWSSGIHLLKTNLQLSGPPDKASYDNKLQRASG